MATELAGKSALVTGASRGIGKAIAFALAGQGANVMLSSRKQGALDEVAGELRAAHPDVTVATQAAHVADPEAAAACVRATVDELGSLDVLVNNAGANPYFGPMVDIEYAQAQKTVAVNQLAVITWIQQAHRAWMAEHGGAVVNMASVGGLVTEPGIGFYNATKSAIIHMTRQFAVELGPGIRVNAIAPGLVRTHMARALWEPHEEHLNETLPLRRIGEPEDIAGAAVFLAGRDSAWITGHTLVVDGGAAVRPNIG
jgi:NAD(P)-dependent dehydrogenase (short-subunit alcohol dehydrogenase family)